jgi:hypothetical protein
MGEREIANSMISLLQLDKSMNDHASGQLPLC